MGGFTFPEQVQGSVQKVNEAFDPNRGGKSQGATVTEKEYNAALEKFASEQRGGWVERAIDKVLPDAVAKVNVEGRTEAFRKAFPGAEPEKRLMVDCISNHRPYAEFSVRLEALREKLVASE